MNLKLSSEWNIQQKSNMVYVTKLDEQHMAPSYKIIIGQSLRFETRVLAWVLLDNQDMYGQYDCSFENVFLSSRVYTLNSYNIWQGTLAHLEC